MDPVFHQIFRHKNEARALVRETNEKLQIWRIQVFPKAKPLDVSGA